MDKVQLLERVLARPEEIWNEKGAHGFLVEVRGLLQEVCGKSGAWDIAGSSCQKGHDCIEKAVNILAERGFLIGARSILLEWWNQAAGRQFEQRGRVYRAILAFWMAQRYITNDHGSAMRWSMLTQAADILDADKNRGVGGKQLLTAALGMSEQELEEINKIADQNREIVEGKFGRDWSVPEGFPEDVIVKFALRYPHRLHLFARRSDSLEYPICPAYLEALLRKTEDQTLNSDEKGKAFEDLGSYLFLLIPGCVPSRNRLGQQRAFESDIVVQNLSGSDSPIADLFGRQFLVECKNRNDRVGVADVGFFLQRMHLTHSAFGVMMAKTGITGSDAIEDEQAAHALIKKCFHEDGSTCVVVDMKALKSLVSGKTTFIGLLQELKMRAQFGKSILATRNEKSP